MLDDQRAALALIAIITGFMACIQGVVAMPAGSTAMLANALIFVQHSVSASVASWATTIGQRRSRFTVQLQGIAMVLLGALVIAVSVRRFLIGSVPHPELMVFFGFAAVIASLACGAIVLRNRGMSTNLATVWNLSRTDAVSNIAVIAAALAVALTRSRIPDLVIGGAMAAFFALSGWRIASSGQLTDRPLP